MSVDLSAKVAVDPADASYGEMLQNLQGNILKSHGRGHVLLLLLRFTAPPEEARRRIREFAQSGLVTSAWKQLEEAAARRRGEETGVFGSFLLTAMGYEALGFSRERVESAFPEPGRDVRFIDGMAKPEVLQWLKDPDPAGWEEPFQATPAGPLHALFLLAAKHPDALAAAADEIERSLQGAASVRRQAGDVLRNEHEESIEPFGFVDGRSQPLFFTRDLERDGGDEHWQPLAPLSLALVHDPFTEGEDRFGSFLVLRKLEQDVAGFRRRVREVAHQLTEGDEALAGALVMGRFENGAPVAVYGFEVHGAGRRLNNFNYDKDPFGMKCPLHAHIRKVNPRGGSVKVTSESLSDERTRRIVRRGIPYDDLADGTGTGVGLLFMCYQASIDHQFAFIQRTWADNPGFPWPGVGVDPLIGQGGHLGNQRWQRRWNELPPEEWLGFGSYVKLKGGEFFFAPSLPFLLEL